MKIVKKKIRAMAGFLLVALVLSCCTGCGKDDPSQELQSLTVEASAEESKEETEDSKGEDFQKNSTEKEDSQKDSFQEKTSGKENKDSTEEPIYVFVCGAVQAPGVYALEQGSRVYEALILAGGMTPEGAAEYVNQAQPLVDGEQIYIPTKEEVQQGTAGEKKDLFIKTEEDTENDSKVNINTATEEGLKSIPGIGDTRAKSIIQYREENGGFQTIEDLMNVPGIKKGVFEKLKDSITVNAGS